MMIIECDVCGEEIERGDRRKSPYHNMPDEGIYDLCATCYTTTADLYEKQIDSVQRKLYKHVAIKYRAEKQPEKFKKQDKDFNIFEMETDDEELCEDA